MIASTSPPGNSSPQITQYCHYKFPGFTYCSWHLTHRSGWSNSSNFELVVHKYSHLKLLSSFLGYGIDWQWGRHYDKISWQLQTYPVLDETHMLFQICKNDNLEVLQLFLSETRVSPFAVDPHGRTLLDFICQVGIR